MRAYVVRTLRVRMRPTSMCLRVRVHLQQGKGPYSRVEDQSPMQYRSIALAMACIIHEQHLYICVAVHGVRRETPGLMEAVPLVCCCC